MQTTDNLNETMIPQHTEHHVEYDEPATRGVDELLQSSSSAVNDLLVIECALRAANDENNPMEGDVRHTVIDSATRMLHERIVLLDDALDSLLDATS